MKKNLLVCFTKYLIDFMFFAGIVVCGAVPWLFKVAGKYYRIFKEFYIPYTIIFIIAGVFALIILWNLRKMFRSVIEEDPFIQENVISLKVMGICSFAIAIMMAIRLFFIITPAALILVVVFLVAGLFSLVLSQVFDRAVTYKLENDFTI
ncbi:MAG TPA: DUF2975 domain-containing protein [Epulopiscium sp.]|nr:DUF2975 domain-containing protein [Candidatus Epulonipiscium sp.]